MSKKQRKSILYFYDILAGIHALILLIIIGRNHNIDLFENCKLEIANCKLGEPPHSFKFHQRAYFRKRCE